MHATYLDCINFVGAFRRFTTAAMHTCTCSSDDGTAFTVSSRQYSNATVVIVKALSLKIKAKWQIV